MKRIERYRRASRQATGNVTGFIGEFFGAVQAVKVATAEQNVINHFHELNDERRVLTLKEKLFDQILHSIYHNMATFGTGIILILVGESMRTGDFTVGDFSLFVYLLGSMGDLTTFAGMLAARYKQMGVSVQRMYRSDGRRTTECAGRTQCYRPGWPAPGSYIRGIDRCRSPATAGSAQPVLSFPGNGPWHFWCGPDPEARLPDRYYREGWLW